MSYLHAAGHRLEYKWIHPRARAPGRPPNAMPVLVFLHEGLGSVALWKNFPELVAEATGCSALVYSRYGYGKSDRLTEPRAIDYLHREALESLPQVLDELSIHNPVLIGHSDGASIALIYSSSGVAEALVLIAPHVFVEDCTLASIRDSGTAFETTDMKVKLARYHADPASTFWGWNEIWLRPEFRRWNIEVYLPCVQCPVLLIQCEDDPYGSLAQICRYRAPSQWSGGQAYPTRRRPCPSPASETENCTRGCRLYTTDSRPAFLAEAERAGRDLTSDAESETGVPNRRPKTGRVTSPSERMPARVRASGR